MKSLFPSLIGLRKENAELAAFVAAIPHEAKHDEFGGLKIEHFPAEGISLYFDESDRLRTVFLHSGRTADGSRYSGLLPAEVSFDFGRGDAMLRLGAPDCAGERWDRWVFEGEFLHFKYSADCSCIETIRVFAMNQNKEGEPNKITTDNSGASPLRV